MEALGPGDIVWIDLDPPVGHEQAGRRPALVVSAAGYNAASTFTLLCPITSSGKAWGFKHRLAPGGPVAGWVIVDQVKSVDTAARFAKPVGRVAEDDMAAVRRLLAALLDLPDPAIAP